MTKPTNNRNTIPTKQITKSIAKPTVFHKSPNDRKIELLISLIKSASDKIYEMKMLNYNSKRDNFDISDVTDKYVEEIRLYEIELRIRKDYKALAEMYPFIYSDSFELTEEMFKGGYDIFDYFHERIYPCHKPSVDKILFED
jgi:hypothetical protein